MKFPKLKFSNLLALFALLVSTISLYFSYLSIKIDNIETIQISSKRYQQPLVPINIDTTNFDLPVISVFWKCIISNNSKRTVSILNYMLKQIENRISSRVAFPLNYDDDPNDVRVEEVNVDLGCFNEELKTKNFPLSISPDESTVLLFKVAVRFKNEIRKKIFKNYSFKNDLSYKDIQNILLKDSLDIFGNKVLVKEYDKGFRELIIGSGDNVVENVYEIIFVTAKDNIFSTKLYWYPK